MGKIGHASYARGLVGAFEGAPVQLSVFEPPSGPAPGLYLPYVRTDIGAAEFRRTVFEGLARDEVFASKLLQLDVDYGGRTGRQIVQAIVADEGVLAGRGDLDALDRTGREGRMFEI